MKIVFLDQYSVHKSDLSAIKSLGEYVGYDTTEPSQIVERCADADVVITNKSPFKADIFAALPNLKLLCIAATGMNNVDLEAAAAHGVKVRNAVGYSTYSVAESTLGGVLALMKQTLYYDNFVKSGQYTTSPRLFDFGRTTHQLHGKRWGIIGLGNIGRQVAQLASAFGCQVAYYSTSGQNNNAEYPQMTLEELLTWSDVVSIHAPLSRTTYNLIARKELQLMKPSAIIVNVARGSIINETDLMEALNNDTIAGAVLDVYSHEPMLADSPILKVNDPLKLITTPHSTWTSEEALQELVDKVAENIRNQTEAAQ